MSEVKQETPQKPQVTTTETGFELLWPQSNNIAATRYNPALQILEVEFKNGKAYEYFEVAPAVWDALIVEESIGTYFYSNIRGKFTCSPILK